jgi:uncharacterized membrane protein YtjA (UPF0391 family)
MTLLTLGLLFLGIALITAMFAFGMLSTPFQGTARIVFYAFLIMFLGTLLVAVTQQYGYDPTPPPAPTPP